MFCSRDRRIRRERLQIVVLACLSSTILARSVSAQVVLDGKFGTSGPLTGTALDIPATVGSVRGNNLFHSFQQFDLKAGDVATFSGPANIQNILTRVTGPEASSINGTIRSSIIGANFFLINPNGLLFGPNAKVDVSGSFAVSSANYLKLADGARFFASLDADDSTLTTAPVSGFGFLNGNPGKISMEGSGIQGRAAKTISIVGGDVSVDGGFVRSVGGDIDIASVKSAGEIPANLASISGAEFQAAFPTQGQIDVREGARVDVNGRGGGRVVIRGGSLQVNDARIESNTTGNGTGRGIDIAVKDAVDISNNGQINSASTQGAGPGGSIRIDADSVRLEGGGVTDPFFNPTTQISTGTGDFFFGGGGAKGGDISINARHVKLENSAQISSATFGAGNAGRIDIAATTVELDAKFVIAQITANSQLVQGGGQAGDVQLRADHLRIENGATVLAASFGSGAAGTIDVEANSMELLRGGVIVAAAFGSGSGGNVRVQAGTLFISGEDRTGAEPDIIAGIQAVTTSLNDPAPGGNIQITAQNVTLDHGGSIFTTSRGAGKGGDIHLVAHDITLDNGSSFRASGLGTGAAGKLAIEASGGVSLQNESAISTSAPLSSGGDIGITAGSEIRLSNSQITAQAGLNGGNIAISAPQLIYLLNSTLTAQADRSETGFGNGGNLTVNPSSFLIMNAGSLISKSSLGNGGKIDILADNFLRSVSLIDASAPFGLAGTVSVTAPEIDLSGFLAGLSSDVLDADSQLRPDCAVRLSEDLSSFVVLGRGGLPIQPGGFMPSGMTLELDEKR